MESLVISREFPLKACLSSQCNIVLQPYFTRVATESSVGQTLSIQSMQLPVSLDLRPRQRALPVLVAIFEDSVITLSSGTGVSSHATGINPSQRCTALESSAHQSCPVPLTWVRSSSLLTPLSCIVGVSPMFSDATGTDCRLLLHRNL
jgi:hypothetical protein